MLPLATTTWDSKEYEALQKVIDSGMFSMGKYVSKFEKNFADFVGSKYCVMVNSGSSANLIGIASMFYRKENPLRAGDEVIVPAVSWSTTYFPLYQYGLKIKFVDIDINTLNIDLKKLEDAITDKTRAIFSVNLLGNPVEYSKMKSIVGSRNIDILEDNCESLGASIDGEFAGTFGLFGTYSSFFSHHISTMEGGLVTTDDEELYHIMLSVRSHGWTRHLPDDNKVCIKENNAFDESFRFILPGYNLRPLEMSGALGIEQLKKLPDIISGRRKNAETFKNSFDSINGVSIQKECGESSWFGFALLINEGKEKRNEIVNMLTSSGVDCRPVVAGNFAKNPVVKYFDYQISGDLSSADRVDECGFFIGNHHYDIESEIHDVSNLIVNAL